jgi:hypothetical protein
MTRLVDELLATAPRMAGGGYNPPDELRTQVLNSLEDQLSACEVFLIDNVADYWNANGGWQRPLHKEDFPNAAPPFGQFFVEHRLHDENGQTEPLEVRADRPRRPSCRTAYGLVSRIVQRKVTRPP